VTEVSYGEGFGVATSTDGQHWTDHGYVWHGPSWWNPSTWPPQQKEKFWVSLPTTQPWHCASLHGLLVSSLTPICTPSSLGLRPTHARALFAHYKEGSSAVWRAADFNTTGRYIINYSQFAQSVCNCTATSTSG